MGYVIEHGEGLVAKVKAINRANDYANKLSVELERIFKPLVGVKVEKNNGQLMERFKKLLPNTINVNSVGLQVYKLQSDYSLGYVVKTRESYSLERQGWGDSCVYFETVVYVGELQHHVLTKICVPVTTRRTDYNAEEVIKTREKVAALKKVYEEAKNELGIFDE